LEEREREKFVSRVARKKWTLQQYRVKYYCARTIRATWGGGGGVGCWGGGGLQTVGTDKSQGNTKKKNKKTKKTNHKKKRGGGGGGGGGRTCDVRSRMGKTFRTGTVDAVEPNNGGVKRGLTYTETHRGDAKENERPAYGR